MAGFPHSTSRGAFPTLRRVKILFIGDIVGEPGRKAVAQVVPVLRARHGLDVVVANGENSAGGSGITPKTAADIFAAGVDVITTGDHLWDQKEVVVLLNSEPRFLRPLNYPPGTAGRGAQVFELPGLPPFAVLNVQGRVFMPDLDNPFACVPPEVVEILNKAFNTALADPKMRKRIADLGAEPMPMTPGEFGKLVADETEKWGKVVNAANITVE